MTNKQAIKTLDRILKKIDDILLGTKKDEDTALSSIAARLVDTGLEQDAAKEIADVWLSLGATPEIVEELFSHSRAVEEVEVLLVTGMSHDEGKLWEDAGFELTSKEFQEWFTSFDTPGVAKAWRDTGMCVDEALQWSTIFGEDGMELAVEKCKEGLTPEQVLEEIEAKE